jgi:hypothetical protein
LVNQTQVLSFVFDLRSFRRLMDLNLMSKQTKSQWDFGALTSTFSTIGERQSHWLLIKQPCLYRIHYADCSDWLRECKPRALHAVCTDPPYGVLEFTEKEVSKLRAGRGGMWRLPPTIGGSQRDPLPRFTVLTGAQKLEQRRFFHEWGKALLPALVPGAHVCVAGHPILQHLVQNAMVEAGYEVRTAIMRLYFSFRGGDRPKNAEKEFPEVCVTPKGVYEPWMLFRKPIEEKTVAGNLRKWKTGGLRRLSVDKPLPDSIPSGRTPSSPLKNDVFSKSHG